MKNKFEFKGLWRLPQNESMFRAGDLTYDPEIGISLELIGSLGGQSLVNGEENHEVILGVLTNGQNVTLIGCKGFGSNSINPISMTAFEVRFALFGKHHLPTVSELNFSSCNFHVSYLDEWVDISGIEVDMQAQTISYRQPVEIKVFESAIERVFIWFAYEGPNSGYFVKHSRIEQKTKLAFEFITPSSIDQILERVEMLRNFISFGVSHPSNFTSVTLSKKTSTKTHSYDFFFKSASNEASDRFMPPGNMLFSFSDIQPYPNRVFEKWFLLYEDLHPVMDLYFRCLYYTEASNINYFLNLVFALETLHRRTVLKSRFTTEDYQMLNFILRDSLDSHSNKRFSDWLNEKLAYGNELSLRGRLTELIQNSHEVMHIKVGDVKTFVSKIVDTRNYHVHFDRSLKAKAIDKSEMPQYCIKLKVLLQISLLKNLAFTNELISNIRRTPTYWNA